MYTAFRIFENIFLGLVTGVLIGGCILLGILLCSIGAYWWAFVVITMPFTIYTTVALFLEKRNGG